jgi:import inner membrane translocase subunit TIM21
MVRQSGNLLIVVAGAGLFVVLAIALSTELFAKNSPSVLYSECIDMIRGSDALDRHLLPPVAFTHSPHSAAPTRGTAPIQHRVVRHPVSGREHVIISFWAHGRGRDEPEPHSWAKRWVSTATDSLRTAGTFVGLVADPDGPEQPPTKEELEVAAAEARAEREKAAAEAQQGPGFLGRLTQSFSFRPGVKSVRSASPAPPPPGTYKIGEVRADYVKNAAGHYTMLALVVDVPSSRAPYPGRAIVYWSPEADKEGLIERR